MKNHEKLPVSALGPPAPLDQVQWKSNRDFWRIFGENLDFSTKKYRRWVKISKIGSTVFFNTVRWIGSPIFMSFRQRNRCDLYWRLFFIQKYSPKSRNTLEMPTYNGYPIVCRRHGRAFSRNWWFFDQKKSPVKIASIPLAERHKNWWSYPPNGI